MDIVLFTALALIVIVVIFHIAIRFVPHPFRRVKLSDCILTKKLGGLINFGKGGSDVYFHHRPTGDMIVIHKRVTADDWFIEVAIRSKHLNGNMRGEIQSKLYLFEDRFEPIEFQGSLEEGLLFRLKGPGIYDFKVLGSVVRMLTNQLGHRGDARYRLEFRGPYDQEAFDKYISEWLREAKGG